MDYNRIVGMTHEQTLLLHLQIMECVHRTDDPRLKPDFVFFGRFFNNKARVIKYHPETDKLEVEVFYGSKGSSFIERDWDAGYYLHGFEDSSYLPLTYLEEEPPICVISHIQQAYARN